jgi:AAA15 family ATPase/GTPase
MDIQSFKIKNYRSLKDINVGDLSTMVIFYGDNDCGKSNILAFLEILFKEKYITQSITATTEKLTQQNPVGFWRGEIENFSDNYYQNTDASIQFSFVVRFERKEILSLSGIPKEFHKTLPKNKKKDTLSFEGEIIRKAGDKAEIFLKNAKFNNEAFYDAQINSESPVYLSGFKELSQAEKNDTFNKIMSQLDNFFLRIPTDRFLSTEIEKPRDEKVVLSPNTLKNWLFQISHDRDFGKISQQISAQFNGEPFNHGLISMVRSGKEEIEAFVEDKDGLLLPIGRRGSGVQQILIILSYIIQSNAPIVGIEELEINLSPKTQSLIFNDLLQLVKKEDSPVKQIFLTSHSPHIAKRNEAARRGVWMENGETHVKKPSEADIADFFRH